MGALEAKARVVWNNFDVYCPSPQQTGTTGCLKSVPEMFLRCGCGPTFADRYSAACCCGTVGSVPAMVARRMSRGCDWS